MRRLITGEIPVWTHQVEHTARSRGVRSVQDAGEPRGVERR